MFGYNVLARLGHWWISSVYMCWFLNILLKRIKKSCTRNESDAMHTLSGDTGFPVHYQQSWLWTALCFFFLFFQESCGWPKSFPEKPDSEFESQMMELVRYPFITKRKKKKKNKTSKKHPKSLNEPQKHYSVQWSVIICNKSTMDCGSQHSPMISLAVSETVTKYSHNSLWPSKGLI